MNRSLACAVLVLAISPVVLVGTFYYGSFFTGSRGLRGGSGDAAFYTVQTWRVGKMLRGQWWRQAEPLGSRQPYPPDTTRLPHVFEGVDVMLLSVLTSCFLPEVPDLAANGGGNFTARSETSQQTNSDPTLLPQSGGLLHGGLASPVVNFNVLSVAVLLANGWVFGGYVYRVSRGLGWSILAQVLVTLNWSTAFQFNTHLNWYKHAWVLAVMISGFRFWEKPTLRRAACFGLCAAMLTQSSWYFTYLLCVALAMLWVILAVRGSVGLEHVRGFLVAGATLGVVGGAWTAPYWLQKRGAQEQFQKRDLRDLLWFSSEPAQYVLPFWSRAGQLYHAARLRYSPLASDKEIWHYPGVLVLATLAGYAVWVLRRNGAGDRDRRRLDYFALVSGLLVFESLTGGMSVLLYKVAPQFRVYGRSGVIAVGLWAIMAPLLLQRFSRCLPTSAGRAVFCSICLLIALADGWFCRQALTPPQPRDTLNLPSWAPWLARQPKEIRAAILPIIPEDYVQSYWWFFHRHEVLNTCDIRFCQDEVEQAGGARDQTVSPELLEVLRKRGYSLLILGDKLWEKYPWIETAEGIVPLQQDNGWRAYRLPPLSEDE